MSALNIKKGSTSHSAYNLRDTHPDTVSSHVLTVVVENEPGVLARVTGLFSGRGYNIDSLTVAEVDNEGHLSRITVVTSGTAHVIEQIKAQLGRIVSVRNVRDLTVEGKPVQRELALLRVLAKDDAREESVRLADIFRARVVETTPEECIFEMTGLPEKIDAFIEQLRPLGLSEIARSGVAALAPSNA